MSWVENTLKPITVIYPETDELKGYYKPRTSNASVPFTEISGAFEYKGEKVHELMCKFPAGEYLIKVVNETTGIELHTELVVKNLDKTEFEIIT